MGNTVEQWRASTGSWTRGCKLQHGDNCKLASSPLWYFLLVVLVLLVIGGVELNPGPVQTYKRTTGCCGTEGSNYEIKMSALLFLRALQTQKNFHIASNLAAAGKFDDVVLKLGDSTCFLQLKHKMKSQTTLKLHQLVHDKDFRLKKYLESLQEIKTRWQTVDDLKECGRFVDAKFVIFTNVSVSEGLVNDANTADLSIVNTGGKLVCLTELFSNLPRYKALLSEAVSSGNVTDSPELLEVVHKLYNKQVRVLPKKKQLQEMLGYLECLEDLTLYQDLVPQLFLCTEQSDESNLDHLIKQEIHSDKLFDQLFKAVTNWWRTSNEYLTQDWKEWTDMFKSCVASIIEPNPPINVKFTSEHCDAITRGNRKLLLISNCTNLSTVKVLQAFVNNTLVVDVRILQESVNEVMTVWSLGTCDVLVVKGWNTHVTALVDKLSNLPESKCLVVISDTPTTVQQFVTVSDQFCFGQLEADSQRQVLERQVDFQGYPVSLNSLADITFLQSQLSEDVVEQVHYTLQVGQKLQELDPCYLQRTFLRNDIVSKQIFGEELIILAISGVHKDKLAELVPSGEEIIKFNQENFIANKDCRFWLIEGETEFRALCAVKDNVHWVEARELGFHWLQSKGDMSHITKHLKGQSTRNADSIVGLPQQVVLVVAEPGMGKTTEMVNIAHVVKRNDPSTWVVSVNLNEWASLITSRVTAVEFLQQVASLKTEFEKHLLEHQLLCRGNVVVLADGFDEISPNYTEQVFELLSKFSKCKIKKIFVTSRPVMKENLEQNLTSLAFSIRVFNHEDQINSVLRYWDQNARVKEFISLLLKRVMEMLNDRWNEFTGIPLQCRMLAEVFHDDANHFYRTGEVRIPPCLDVLLLYEQFVDKKFRVYYSDKLNINVNTAMLHHLIQTQKLQIQQSYMNCAMISYFNNEYIETLLSSKTIKASNEQFVNKFNLSDDQIGIITHIVHKKAIFVHRTFAEYFVAMWFSQNFQTESKLTEQIYFDGNFKVIQKFLDRMLAKGHPLHTAVINVDLGKVNCILEQSRDVNERDRGGRTALQVAIMNLMKPESPFLKETYNDIHTIIDTLLEHGADVNCEEDKVLHCRPLRFAEESEAWSVVDKLLGKQADDTDLIWIRANIEKREACRQPSVESENGMSVEYCMSDKLEIVMYKALVEGYVNLVKFILDCGISAQHEIYDLRRKTKHAILHRAVVFGQLEMVQLLIERGSDINIYDSFQRTPLMAAAEHGHVQVAELLVQLGADVNARNKHGITALSLSAQMGKHEIVNILLPLTSDSDIDSVICAAGHGYMEAANILIKNKMVNSQDEDGKTALLLAVNRGKQDTVEFLLKHGADVNISNEGNRTPLMLAARCGLLKIVELLVQLGADVNARNKFGDTALSLSAESGKREVVNILLPLTSDSDMDSVICAAGHGYVKAAQILIKNKMVNSRDRDGRTALLLAADVGKHDTVEFLLQHGADVNISDKCSRTPLMLAARCGHLKIAELLVQLGADVNARNKFGDTALSSAVERGNHELVNYLLSLTSYSDIDSVIYAAGYGDVEAAQILIKNKTINSQDKNGNTALLLAASQGKDDTVGFLLEHGADVDISKEYKRKLMIHAARCGLVKLAELLVQRGADVHTRDERGETAVKLAIMFDHDDVAKLLLQHGAKLLK